MKIVVKVGSAILSKPEGGLNPSSIHVVVSQLAALHTEGHHVLLVSSGAIAAGVGRLRLSEKPKDLRMKQATAAVGQLALMEAYEKAFSAFQIIPAQILLTRDDLTHRDRYVNVRNTLLKLLEMRTVPIINENDTVSTDEIKFGDNDSLSAIVATKINADVLILLSDVDGLFELDKNGRLTDTLIPEVARVSAQIKKLVSSERGSKLSTGGMAAKLAAAQMATTAGVETWIGSGRRPDILAKILAGEKNVATRFRARRAKRR